MRHEKEADLTVEDNDGPAANFIQEWLDLRVAQGLTREAAIAELNAAGWVVAGVKLAHD